MRRIYLRFSGARFHFYPLLSFIFVNKRSLLFNYVYTFQFILFKVDNPLFPLVYNIVCARIPIWQIPDSFYHLSLLLHFCGGWESRKNQHADCSRDVWKRWRIVAETVELIVAFCTIFCHLSLECRINGKPRKRGTWENSLSLVRAPLMRNCTWIKCWCCPYLSGHALVRSCVCVQSQPQSQSQEQLPHAQSQLQLLSFCPILSWVWSGSPFICASAGAT